MCCVNSFFLLLFFCNSWGDKISYLHSVTEWVIMVDTVKLAMMLKFAYLLRSPWWEPMEGREADSTNTLFTENCKVWWPVNSTNGKLPSLGLIYSYIGTGFCWDIGMAKPIWCKSVQALYKCSFLKAQSCDCKFLRMAAGSWDVNVIYY